jgi:hypothetical protein
MTLTAACCENDSSHWQAPDVWNGRNLQIAAADRAEFSRMVPEKVEAFSVAGIVMLKRLVMPAGD